VWGWNWYRQGQVGNRKKELREREKEREEREGEGELEVGAIGVVKWTCEFCGNILVSMNITTLKMPTNE
jgi:hypothetical protein